MNSATFSSLYFLSSSCFFKKRDRKSPRIQRTLIYGEEAEKEAFLILEHQINSDVFF